MSHDAVRRYHYRGILGVWLTTVTVWLFPREGVAKSPCKCGSGSGIYIWLGSELAFVADSGLWIGYNFALVAGNRYKGEL